MNNKMSIMHTARLTRGEIENLKNNGDFTNFITTIFKGGSKEGMYFLYGGEGELLYIGWSKLVNERVGSHLNGSTNTRRFCGEIGAVGFLSLGDMDLYRNANQSVVDIEEHFIKKYKPIHNIAYAAKEAA